MKPINPNAKWKKLFSREYAVQYTEVSLRSMSPELKGIAPFVFYEQIYVPENSNEVCYADETNWNKFLDKMYSKWNPSNVNNFKKVFMRTGNDYLNFAKKVSKLNLKNASHVGGDC